MKVLLDAAASDVWHDPLLLALIGGAATLLAGFISAVVTYWIYRRQRSKKEIMFQIISDVSVASVDLQMAERVEIRFDGKRVENLRLLVLKLWNSGNASVKPEDYIEPIIFEFKGRIVLGADVLNMEPEGLINPKALKTFLIPEQVFGEVLKTEPSLKSFTLGSFTLNKVISLQRFQRTRPNGIRLDRFLFGPKESITLKVLLTGPRGEINARARIIDGKITDFNTSSQSTTISISDILTPPTYFVIALPAFLFVPQPFNLIVGTLSLIIGVLALLLFFLVSDTIIEIRKKGLKRIRIKV